MSKLIEITKLSFSYSDLSVLKDVNFAIESTDFIGVIGPNGGGKTTLLKIIMGLLKPISGEISYVGLGEKPLEQIGYLPQIKDFDTKFPISVYDVVKSGLVRTSYLSSSLSQVEKGLIDSTLEKIGISNLAKRSVGELSGGQLQRVFLCRALVSSPKLLVLDEPDSYVDSRFEKELYELLVELNKEIAIVLVSHDLGTISYYVKSIACVNQKLHYHKSNIISQEQLESYNCPIQIITHGEVPHTVLKIHNH